MREDRIRKLKNRSKESIQPEQPGKIRLKKNEESLRKSWDSKTDCTCVSLEFWGKRRQINAERTIRKNNGWKLFNCSEKHKFKDLRRSVNV